MSAVLEHERSCACPRCLPPRGRSEPLGVERFEAESPFLDSSVMVREAYGPEPIPELEAPWAQGATPFLRDQFLVEGDNGQLAEAVAEMFESLHDEDFNRTLYEMAARAQATLGDQFTSSYLPPEQAEIEVDRQMTQHFSLLATEAARMYDRMADGLERTDARSLTPPQLEALLDQFAPDPTGLAPEQEEFLGKLFDKAKKAVQGVVNAAKSGAGAVAQGLGRLGLRPILDKLRGLVMPILQRVIRFATKRLPPAVRPIARRLAQKIFGTANEFAADELGETESLAAESPDGIQMEYDMLVTEALFVTDEVQLEGEAVEFARAEAAIGDPVARFNVARDALVQQLAALDAGQDPKPVIQQFLPAALMALQPIIKAAIGIIGRERVVDFLAGMLAQLVARWIGEEPAKQLAKPVISTGLGLLGFETPPDPRLYAAEVLGQTLQETVLSLAREPAATFESPVLMQVAVQDAFEKAAASNFPPEVVRPELREDPDNASGQWVLRPSQQRRKYYKKRSQTLSITLSKAQAAGIKVFGGANLADHLEATRIFDWKQPIKVKLHLYEITLGARLADISVHEKGVNGLGTYHWQSWSQILPLTPEAAQLLTGQPGLGKAVGQEYLMGPYLVAPGQRFYYLEFPAPVRPRPPAVPAPAPAPGKKTESKRKVGTQHRVNRIGVIFDIGQERATLKIRLTEDNAQRIAQALKRNDIAGAFHVIQALRDLVRGVLNGKTQTGVTVIPPKANASEVLAEQFAPAVAAAATAGASAALKWVLEKIGEKLFEAAWSLLENYFRNKAQEFIAAADDGADGVTVFVSFSNLKPLSVAKEAMLGNYASAWRALQSMQVPYPSIYSTKGWVA